MRRSSRRYCRRGRGSSGRREHGFATAEIAVALPVLALFIVVAVWAIGVATAQLRCVDAARAGARGAARGEQRATVVDAARRLAPAGAVVSVVSGRTTVSVVVSARAGPHAGVLSRLPRPTVSATAVAVIEPGLGPAP